MTQTIKGASLSAWAVFSGSLLGLAGFLPAASAQTTPAAVVVQSSALTTINGNAGHVAANSLGDAFYMSQTDGVLYRVKHGTTTPIALVTGLTSGSRSVYVDSSNNVYVSSNYSNLIIEVPYISGTYAAGSAKASLAACGTSTPAAPCTQFGGSGYWQATDLGMDGAGHLYLIDTYNGAGTGGAYAYNAILELTYTGSTYTSKAVVQNQLPNNINAQMIVDKAGDIFYADGTNLFEITASSIAQVNANTITSSQTGLVKFGAGLKTPVGTSLDQYGNLYVTDSTLSQILEFPALNGVPQIGTQLIFDPTYSANGVGLDGVGDMYYTGYSGGTNLNVAHINSFSLGSAAIGTPVSTTGSALTVNFIAPETLAAPILSGAGVGFSYTAGTCAAATAYTAGQTCTINVNYTPTSVGLQSGAVTLTNATGAVIAVAELAGSGAGAAQTVDPGTASTIGSGYTSAQGIAVDGAKNVYIANTGKNTVVEYAAGSSTAVSLGSGLSGPTSVALDNAGNLYIADSGNGRVVEVPSIAGVLTTSAQSVVVGSLGSSLGIATDPYGNLYVADSKNNKIIQLGPINGTPSTSASQALTLPATSVAPFALATDNTGNLFIADITASTVTELAYYGKGLSSIGTGYSHPSGLATDASGGLYVADPGNYRLIKIPFESPNYNTNDQYSVGPPFTVATGVNVPYAVAVDSSANLYVLDSQDATVTFLNRNQGTLNLGSSNVASTTAQQSSYIADAGNQSLVLGNPDYTTTASPAFTITAPSTNGCANSKTLLAGFSCVLQATFDPPAALSYSQTLAFKSNAANTATPSLTLVGQGLNAATTTLTLAQTSPTGTPVFGQTVVITATLASTTAGTFSGDILIYIDGNFYSYKTVTGPSVSFNVIGLLGGMHSVAVSYTGNTTFASSSASLSLTIAPVATTLALLPSGAGVTAYPPKAPAIAINAYPNSAAPGAAVTLTATVSVPTSTEPTGFVTFTLGSTTLGTAPVNLVGNLYQAVLVVSTLPTASDTIVGQYSGDQNYLPSSAPLTIIISLPTLTLTPSTQTITVGQSATATGSLQVASLSGFGSSSTGAYVGLTCVGLPANTACSFNPNGFPLQANNLLTAQQTVAGVVTVPATYGSQVVTITIETGQTPVISPPTIQAGLRLPGTQHRVPASLAFLALAPLALLLRRKAGKFGRPLSLLSLLLLFGASITGLSACSGSNFVVNTPTGTYPITVTAVSTNSGVAVTAATLLAPGCTVTPATTTYTTTTYATCTQTTQFTLVVK